MQNYRPISLTSITSKILEHVPARHIITYVQTNNLIGSHQYIFRRGRSTVTQLIEVTHDLSLCIVSGGQVDVAFPDFAKSFDNVSHPKLLHKLKYMLNNYRILTWVGAYLIGREQFVQLNNVTSVDLSAMSGAPQESVLGPLLFILYISDMNWGFETEVKIKHFADNTITYSNIGTSDDQKILNEHLY